MVLALVVLVQEFAAQQTDMTSSHCHGLLVRAHCGRVVQNMSHVNTGIVHCTCHMSHVNTGIVHCT